MRPSGRCTGPPTVRTPLGTRPPAAALRAADSSRSNSAASMGRYFASPRGQSFMRSAGAKTRRNRRWLGRFALGRPGVRGAAGPRARAVPAPARFNSTNNARVFMAWIRRRRKQHGWHVLRGRGTVAGRPVRLDRPRSARFSTHGTGPARRAISGRWLAMPRARIAATRASASPSTAACAARHGRLRVDHADGPAAAPRPASKAAGWRSRRT